MVITILSNKKSKSIWRPRYPEVLFTPACKPGSNEILNPQCYVFASRISMALPLVLLGYTMAKSIRNSRVKMAATKTGSIYISACRLDSNKISNPNIMFLGSGISIALVPCPFVGVDLNLLPTVHVDVIVLKRT